MSSARLADVALERGAHDTRGIQEDREGCRIFGGRKEAGARFWLCMLSIHRYCISTASDAHETEFFSSLLSFRPRLMCTLCTRILREV